MWLIQILFNPVTLQVVYVHLTHVKMGVFVCCKSTRMSANVQRDTQAQIVKQVSLTLKMQICEVN